MRVNPLSHFRSAERIVPRNGYSGSTNIKGMPAEPVWLGVELLFVPMENRSRRTPEGEDLPVGLCSLRPRLSAW
ncbi:MAG: hypothetical protein ACJ72H_24155 [Candidatus Sulfotelmatobacter sp.]